MLKINPSSPVPIYEQLVEEIKHIIQVKELAPGDVLPTIRTLASQLDVAVNTVARAYQELERLNLIESRGRKGSFVKDNPLSTLPRSESKIFKEPILKLIQKGMGRKDIQAIFHSNLSQIFD
jgi:GntR family transcriptional regulator